MDTHIKNGPLDAFRMLFVRLKGAQPSRGPQQRRCNSIPEKKQTSHQTKHPECNVNLLDKNQNTSQQARDTECRGKKKDARCTNNNFVERYNRGRYSLRSAACWTFVLLLSASSIARRQLVLQLEELAQNTTLMVSFKDSSSTLLGRNNSSFWCV